MKLNEHNSKRLFAEAGLPVPDGVVLAQTDILDVPFPLPWVLKAQVLSGGRGKAGGILVADTQEQARTHWARLMSLTIQGEPVRLVRIEPKAAFIRELYLSASVNRAMKSICVTAGRMGGVDIESAAPETIYVENVDMDAGLQPFQIRNLFFHLELPKDLARSFSSLVQTFFDLCLHHRLLLAEINPLVLTPEHTLLVLDGKVECDDHQVSIDPDLNRFFEPAHLRPEEIRSRAAGLSFHSLDGFVGLMVNGAGLAMATMDALNYEGLEAANFLDLGGGADVQAMRTAMNLLFDDSRVSIIFINIFGGILSCEHVAQSMLEALNTTSPHKPVIVRFSGNSADQGLALLRAAGLTNLFLCADLSSALTLLHQHKGQTHPSKIYRPVMPPSSLARPARHRTARATFPLPDDCRIVIQGITGKQGQLHCKLMQEYGSRIVAGVTPGKGGHTVYGVPVFNTVREAALHMRLDASVIFVPGAMAPDAVLEAAAAGIPWVICITDGIPQQNMLRALTRLRGSSTRVIGPNCPGLVMPGRTKLGIMPGDIFLPGPVAVFSRSGTLTYECVNTLTQAGIGQSVCIGIGGDPFIGTSFTELCALVRHDPQTKAVVILGEIGGTAEEELGAYMQETDFELPVFGFIAGQTAPPGKRLGHAGAILEQGGSGIEGKLKAMAAAGFQLVPSLDKIAEEVARVL